MKSIVENVRVVDPGHTADSTDTAETLVIENGVISARITNLEKPSADQTADQTIDGSNLFAIPGLIDCYARLREPGFEKKADIRSESKAALYNGITTLICSPDTDPVVDEVATVELINRCANNAGYARVKTLAAMTRKLDGEHLTELATLQAAGCIGATNADVPVKNTLVLRRVMEYASTFDIILMFAPVDSWLTGNGCVHEGTWSTRLGLPGIPIAAETVALGMLLEMADLTGASIHFSRITSARGTSMIRQAKAEGMNVSADTSINHLFYTEACVEDFNSSFHSVAPFRNEQDRAALVDAVIDGTLDAVCSDHSPHEHDAKLAPFPSTAPGLSTLDSYLQLILKFGEDNGLSMAQALKPVTCNPARIFGLNGGSLEVGAPADLVLIDPSAKNRLDESQLLSRGKNSPLINTDVSRDLNNSLKGVVRHVAVDGHWHEVPVS